MPLSNEELKEIFSQQLTKMMESKNINQVELAKILGVSESTVGKWLLKKAMPRMGIIQKLADYFNVGKSYFLEVSHDNYYTDPETIIFLEKINKRPDMKILFDAAEDMSPDDIDFVVNMIENLKKREGK